MMRLFIVLSALVAAWPAAARNITSEVQYYRNIDVIFSENAHVCGLNDPAPMSDLAKAQLSAMDVPHNPDGLVDVVILVTARASGLLEQSCTAYVEVQLQSKMNSSFLNLNTYEGTDETLIMMSERGYVFPIVFYQTGSVFAEFSPTTPERTLKVLAALFENLAKARSLK